MNDELCSSCGGKLDPRKNEILLFVGVGVILAHGPQRLVDVERKTYHICQECGLAGRAPNLDGAMFAEILKAAK